MYRKYHEEKVKEQKYTHSFNAGLPHFIRLAWGLVLSLGLVMVLLETSAYAATYYVDFSGGTDSNNGISKSTPWKHIKGMTGCSSVCNSTTIVGGDTAIFKGGEKWIASFPWTFEGGSSSMVTYTSDQSWFTGGSWTKPTFDYQGGHPGAIGMANLTNAGWVTLDNLKFTRCGVANVADSDKCLVFTNAHHITMTNNTFTCFCWITTYFVFTTSGTKTTFTWTGNDFANTSGAVWFASAAGGAVEQDIIYNNNAFHDYASQIGGGVHGDGAWHGFVIPPSDATQHIDNMQFCNNRFYGDFRRSYGSDGAMTGFFFHEGGLNNAIICNNDMSFTPVTASMFDGLIVLEGESNARSTGIGIYGNTLLNQGTNAMSAAIHVSGSYKNVSVKNNIFVGMKYPFYIEDTGGTGATWASDYNFFHTYSALVWGAAFQSFSSWTGQGRDTHSRDGGTVGFVSTSSPFNLHLTASSSAIGTATNLSTMGIPILSTDRDGVSRGLNYSMGAYQGPGSGGDTLPPAAPINVIVR